MQYSGDIAAAQHDLAGSQDMDARRVVVLDALGAGAGDSVLEVGCGPGLLLARIARSVGPDGRAVGIDVSPDQIAAANQRCADLVQVRLDVGNVRDMPFPDEEFDATVGTQVLEYVEDVDTAVGELARVTRSGGRLVNVATNWGALFWCGGDPSLTRRVLDAWDAHCPHLNLPVTLPSVLARHGFAGVSQRPVTIVNRRFHRDSFSWGAAHLMAAFAQSRGAIDEDGAQTWIASLEHADRVGDHFLSSVPIVTTATARH